MAQTEAGGAAARDSAATGLLGKLRDLDQSIWYDNIERGLIDSGELARLIALGVTGLTSNPTIFQKALAAGTVYDAALQERLDQSPETIFEDLAIDDIQRAADLLRGVYEGTGGRDGFVSLEVSPLLASDTEGTVAAAERLWGRVGRPNLMIKVPATPEGMPAITRLIGAGINVNVTLIFALAAYERVMEAYLAGLERRAADGHSPDRLASVASFFVSRVDTAVDRRIDAKIAATTDDAERERLRRLRGQAAIANAVRAYARFQSTFAGERFDSLAALGARVQRPLWASTSTKDPSLPDLYYVESLAAPNTVDTVPPATLEAILDHGRVASRMEDIEWADGVVRDLAAAGIDLDEVTEELLREGVAAFSASYEDLLAGIAAKREALLPARRAGRGASAD